MTGGNIGRVKKAETKWYTPPPPSVPDENGNVVSRVIGTTRRMTDRLLYLYTSAELIKTTPEHPFSIEGRGWVHAGRLEHGDRIKTQSGKLITVDRVEVRNERQLVYNLKVEGTENFFVGEEGLLVHNGGDCFPSFGMVTYDDLTADGIMRTSAGLTGKSDGYMIYVVRDVETGELLKAGQTQYPFTRFPEYRSRAKREGRQIAIDAFEVNAGAARLMTPTLESQIQRNLWKNGHDLPWDKSRVLKKLRARGR